MSPFPERSGGIQTRNRCGAENSRSEPSAQDGFNGLFYQHTTAALMVSEFQDALLDDIASFLRRVVEDDLPYKHNSPEFSDCDRRNAASHLRSMLFNNSVVLPVSGGELVLVSERDPGGDGWTAGAPPEGSVVGGLIFGYE